MPNDEINLPVLSDELEDNFAGASMRLLTIHFGFPDPPVLNNPSLPKFVRWDLPLTFDDMKFGQLGSRSAMWHPARTLTTNSAGVDGKDFAREGDVEATDSQDIDEWL